MNTDHALRLGLHGIGILCSLIVLVIGYFVGYVPCMVGSQTMGMERARLEKLASSMPNIQNQNQVLEAECEALEDELNKLVRGVPQRAREHELLKSFSDLAEQCDMKLLDFTPSTSSKEGDLGVTMLQMGFRGDYDSTCRLVWALEQMPRLHRVTSMTIRPIDRTNGVFEIRFEMRAFHGHVKSILHEAGSAA